jgi:hypothetical protein
MSSLLKYTMFWKMDPPQLSGVSGERDPTQLDPLGGAHNQNQFLLMGPTEQDPLSPSTR